MRRYEPKEFIDYMDDYFKRYGFYTDSKYTRSYGYGIPETLDNILISMGYNRDNGSFFQIPDGDMVRALDILRVMEE